LMDYGDCTVISTGQDTLTSELRKAGDCEGCLIVVRGTQQGKRFELSSQSMSIGRDATADIVIDDPKVSRRHAVIQKESDLVRLIDGGSTNGSYINDLRIPGKHSVLLNKEDMIKIGNTILKYLPKGELEIHYIGTLESKAHTDSLTKTYNKGYILEAMEAEFKRARALNTAFSLLVVDLDHFKRVNDTHGHDAGDSVLVEVSAILRSAISANRGILGRFGGEEFVALLPSHAQAGALELAESIRETVEHHLVEYDDTSIRITASIGVATMDSDTLGVRDLFRLADRAVYLAKNGGRNKVCCCPA
jgi:two-component system cell cycle response regulator